MKQIELTYEKKCPYCGNTNIHYLGYSRKAEEVLVYSKGSGEEVYDFKCEDCKRIFYYRGRL